MHISGERLVPAPRERVWRSLADVTILRECLPGDPPACTLDADGEGGLLLFSQHADGAGSPAGGAGPAAGGVGAIHAKPSVREQFSTLGWRIDPERPGSQMLLLRLLEQGVFTRLQYELSLADPDDTDQAPRTAALQGQIDQALARFIHAIAGPGEIGAGGIAGAVQAATDPSAQPSASMRATPATGTEDALDRTTAMLGLLNPSVIGGVLFLVVLLFMVGLF